MTPEEAADLRAPFPPESIGKIPKGGVQLDYVGHAATTDRLLSVDPDWTWEPPTSDELQRLPGGDGMWIKLTVCGVSRFGWGDGKNIKEWISDAIRNAAMRFGVALDLWSKEDLRAQDAESGGTGKPARPATSEGERVSQGAAQPASRPRSDSSRGRAPSDDVPSPPVVEGGSASTAPTREAEPTFANKRAQLKARCVQLQAEKVSVADKRAKWNLPLVDECDGKQLDIFNEMLTDLEKALEAPFAEATK